MKSYSIQEINEVIKGNIVGETSIIITAPEQLELAGSSPKFHSLETKNTKSFGKLPKLVLP